VKSDCNEPIELRLYPFTVRHLWETVTRTAAYALRLGWNRPGTAGYLAVLSPSARAPELGNLSLSEWSATSSEREHRCMPTVAGTRLSRRPPGRHPIELVRVLGPGPGEGEYEWSCFRRMAGAGARGPTTPPRTSSPPLIHNILLLDTKRPLG